MVRMHWEKKRHPEVKFALGLLHLKFTRKVRAAITIQRWLRLNQKVDEGKVRESMDVIIQDHEYRTSVIKEILATEETYVKDMDTCIHVCAPYSHLLSSGNFFLRGNHPTHL